jgi:hypothetical protein
VKTLIAYPNFVWRILATLALAACAGCTSSDAPIDGGGDLDIAALSHDPTSKGVAFDAAELSLHRTSLLPCMADAAILQTFDFSIDLLHLPPPKIIFESAVTDFCGLDLDLAPAPGGSLPDLKGLTAVFRGTRADGAAFELHSKLTSSLQFHNAAKVLDAKHLVLGADLEAWLSGVDLDGADTMDDGSVLVDADHNPDLLSAFDGAALTALALYEDTNGDETLTDAELVPVSTAQTPP